MRQTTAVRGLLGTGAALALLLSGTVPALATTGATAAAAPAGVTAAADDAAPTVRTADDWVVTTTRTGSVLRWTPSAELPMGDARVEFALDGRTLGAPTAGALAGPYTLDVPGLDSVDPSRLSVLLGGRRVDAGAPAPSAARGADAGTSAAGPAAKLTQPKTVLKKDPGVKGKLATSRFTYATKGIELSPLYPAAVEVRAEVTLPTAKAKKGKLPVVVFLHGRHTTCYLGTESSGDWPCVDKWKSIPSYKGYRYAASLLASQGYATVSISANGINGQDWVENDGGAASRAALVKHHLELLAKANAGTSGVKALKPLKGRLNLTKVALVGHSRGGEGVNRATTVLARNKNIKVKGQVLIAPTAFGYQTAPGVPTSVILPYCDGDVYDLQGQTYVDQARQGVTGDTAIKASHLILGANHNFFNTEWTPGQAKAPSMDDWWGTDTAECGSKHKGRLSAKQQQAAGGTYIAAAIRAILAKDTSAARLLDGSPVRAKSAGKAVVSTHSTKGRRSMIVNPDTKASTVKAAKGATARECLGGYTADGTSSCLPPETEQSFLSPHWLGADASAAPWGTAVHASWTKKKARITLKSGKTHDLTSKQWLDLRVIEAATKSSGFDLVLRDSKNRSLRLKTVQGLAQLPKAPEIGTRMWAQLVRYAIPAKASKFNLKAVTAFQLVPTTTKGEIYVLDVTATRNGIGKPGITLGSLPQINGTSTTKSLTPLGDGTARADLTFAISGTVKKTAKVYAQTFTADWETSQSLVTIKPGQKSFTVSTIVTDDGSWPAGGAVQGIVVPQREIVTNEYIGSNLATSTVPAPVIDVPVRDVTVTQGAPLVWDVTQTGAPSRSDATLWLPATRQAPGVKELRVGDVPRSWVMSSVGWYPPAATPLSAVEASVGGYIAPFDTQGRIVLPTSATASLDGPRTIRLVLPADGERILEDIVLTGTVNPKP